MKKLIIITAALLGMNAGAAAQVYLDANASVEARVEDALSRMTLEEKVKILHAQSKFTSAGVPRLGIRQLNMDDGPHGVREELQWNSWARAGWTNDYVVAFPSLTCLAATWNRDLAALYGRSVSEEFAYRGKDVMLGPGANIARTPLNGRAFEYMGEDPLLAGEMLVPYVSAVQANGVACCMKHFVLNDMETDRFVNNVNVSDRAANEIYLAPFKRVVEKAHVWAIMGSYNFWKGQHCCHNDTLVNKILKGEWGWDGAYISDWGGTFDTWQAATGGLDIEMGSYTDGKLKESEFTYDDYYLAKPFRKLLAEGKVSENVLNDKARRVLRLIFRTAMNPKKTVGSLCSEAHYDACRKIGEEGIVMLKNKGGILPLDASKYKKILVVGENAARNLAEGGGSSELKTLRDVSPLEALQKAFGPAVVYAQGYASGRPLYDQVDKVDAALQDSLRRDALEKAKQADLVIFIGGLNKNHKQDCENGDREGYDLSFGQNELISRLADIQPNTIVVTFGGNAYAMPWIDRVQALLHCWYLGSESGDALAGVLTGRVNPSGRLPITIARSVSDYPFYKYGERAYPGLKVAGAEGSLQPHRQIYYDEDIFVGYRHFDTRKVKALFPFGFGLSYTTFAFGKPTVSAKTLARDGGKVEVSVAVTNTGKMAGKETVQLYIGEKKPSADRPRKELKDFCKVELQPGETKTVSFAVSPDMLKRFDEKSHSWQIVPGAYTLYLSKDVSDEQQRADIKVM